ncbi:MAG: hypothetical protein ACXWB4_01355 [Kaistella sp.]
MRKIFFFLFCASMLINAQQYHFDVLAKYKTSGRNNKPGETAVYSSSNNGSYFLKIFNNGKHLRAELHDAKNRKRHVFLVNETKKQDEILFSFTYETSHYMHHIPYYRNVHFVTEEIEKNNDESKILVKIFKTQNARKPAKEFKLTLATADKNLFPVFRQLIAHPFEYWDGFNLGRNVVVKRAEYTHVNNYQCVFTLDVLKDVDLNITLPGKLSFN